MATAAILIAILGELCPPVTATTRPATGNIVGEWNTRPPLRKARGGLSAVAVGEQIFAIGGFDQITVNGEVVTRVFDTVETRRVGGSGVWRDVAPMPTARSNFGAAVLHGKVYVTGGVDANDILRSVEVYDPAANRWTHGPSLPQPRGGPAAAVLNDRLYVAGGYNPEDDVLRSMVVLDPQHGTWREVAPMPTARDRLRLVAAGGHLYAIGGSGVTERSLTAVERYDPRTNSWRTMRPMIEARTVPCVIDTVVDKRRLLVAISGAVLADGGDFVDGRRTTEIFDIRTGQWTLLDVLLPMPWGSQGCAHDARGAILAIGGATHVNLQFRFLRDVKALSLRTRPNRG